MIQRRFIVGSEWIYLKIYTGPKIVEQILIYDIIPILNTIIKSGLIDLYYFVRYMDPNYHIRLRLHCPNADNYGGILSLLYEKLNKYVGNLTITRVQLDTYARELERYGGDRIVHYERIFYHDSRLIANCLRKLDCEDDDRYKISIKYIDALLNMCHYNIDQKIDFVDRNRIAYYYEFYENDNSVKTLLNSKYRSKQHEIFNCLNSDSKNNCMDKYISNFSKEMSLIPRQFLFKNESELTSVIHMHINRMFRTRQRSIELVIYWFLYKYYKSQKALKYEEDTNKYK